MRRKLRRTLALPVAALLVITAASTAQAEGYGGTAPFNYHYDYTYYGWDYDYVGTAAINTSDCYAKHTDVFRSRRTLCPWCTWYTNTRVHCIQV